MKVIPKMRRVHYIRYLRLLLSQYIIVHIHRWFHLCFCCIGSFVLVVVVVVRQMDLHLSKWLVLITTELVSVIRVHWGITILDISMAPPSDITWYIGKCTSVVGKKLFYELKTR